MVLTRHLSSLIPCPMSFDHSFTLNFAIYFAVFCDFYVSNLLKLCLIHLLNLSIFLFQKSLLFFSDVFDNLSCLDCIWTPRKHGKVCLEKYQQELMKYFIDSYCVFYLIIAIQLLVYLHQLFFYCYSSLMVTHFLVYELTDL